MNEIIAAMNKLYEDAAKANLCPDMAVYNYYTFVALYGRDQLAKGIEEGWITQAPEGYLVVTKRAERSDCP